MTTQRWFRMKQQRHLGGPSQQLENAQIANANTQTDIANQEFTQSQQNVEKMQQLEAPAISMYQGLTSGDPNKQISAAAPIIGQIQGGFNASKESIMNSIPPGPARDYALSQLNVQSNAGVSGELANITQNAFGQLANIGAGLGAFGLQQTGASLNAFSGSATTTQNVLGDQAQSKADTMGFLGQLVGGVAQVGSSAILAHPCWIAEALYGADDRRTYLIRAWINGPFRATFIGSLVRQIYILIGRPVAWAVRRSSWLRAAFRPLFDAALIKAGG